MNKIAFLAGARPNYMKVFPVWKAARASLPAVQPVLIHSGQHYDDLMSGVFFREFAMEKPTHFLGVGSGPHGLQTAKVMIALEELFNQERPDLLVVVGDVNSTLAGALVAAKMGIPVAHVEAGLRSFDRSMPEEINRLVTDSISDLLLTSSPEARDQLLKENVAPEKIRFVGNVMIDSLVGLLPRAAESRKPAELGVDSRPFVLVTLHRPSNVDTTARLQLILRALAEVARELPVVFPVHPRTRKMLDAAAVPIADGLTLTDPLGYLDFVALESRAALLITDSGGVQEETSFLGIPCLTVRPNTERPITLTLGTNRLIDPEQESLAEASLKAIRAGRRPGPCEIPGWDGQAAHRIVTALAEALGVTTR